jgi:hypothetical protein
MTKIKKDYSTTYVYEITCKDDTFPTKYLGYTTNFKQCKYNHKCAYIREDTGIYHTMAENGGFDNWSITVIHKYCCKDGEEARRMLANHPGYEVLDIYKPQVFSCELCEYTCYRKSHIETHNKTTKHLSITTQTAPDQGQTSELTGLVVALIKQNQEQKQGQNNELTSLVVALMKQNQEQMTELIKSNQQLQSQMIEVCSRPTTQVNNTKNSFNLNVFLNEDCKNAMTLDDFVENLVITEEEIHRQATMSYEEGFAAILKDRLCDNMSVYERPIHYTDAKRETAIYKDRKRNEWVKDENNYLQQDVCREISKQMGNYVVVKFDDIPVKLYDDVMANIVPVNEKQRSKVLRFLIPNLCVPKN